MRCRQSGVCCSQIVFDRANLMQHVGPLLLFLGRVNGDVGLVVVIEESEELVILFLRQRVELVIVALGALDGQAEDALADGVHAVEHGVHAELLRIDAALFVNHRIAQIAGGDDLILRGVGQQIAGQLLHDETVIGQVAVEGVDDPIAIGPDEARLIFLIAVAVGVAGRVKPLPAPAFRRNAATPTGDPPPSHRRPAICH